MEVHSKTTYLLALLRPFDVQAFEDWENIDASQSPSLTLISQHYGGKGMSFLGASCSAALFLADVIGLCRRHGTAHAPPWKRRTFRAAAQP